MTKNKIDSLYIHIPFCEAICNYCDFPKLQYFRFLAEKYLVALRKDLEKTVKNKDLKTIYIGGGTPTVLEDDLFIELLEMIKPFSTEIEEYTIEANPESLTESKIKLMKQYGINRVSIGVESTDNKILKTINRKHTFEDVQIAVERLKKYEIDNFNVDLILGLPNCTKNALKKDLENILSLNPAHISTYSLTVNPHTVFFLEKVEEPNEDFSRELYDLVHKTLSNNGFIHYEISNFAKEGYESKHNQTYWDNAQYYGVGLGAAGYIDDIRYKNTVNLQRYLDGYLDRENEIVDLEDQKSYQIMLNLRTNKGIDLNQYNTLYNEDLYKKNKDIIDKLIKGKCLFIKDNHLIATYEGMMILDRIFLSLE